MGRPGRKRLAIDLPLSVHKSLTNVAKLRNETVTKILVRLIIAFLVKDLKK
jgi:hypothetical protein